MSGVKFVGRSLDQRTYHLGVISAVGNQHISSWGLSDKLQGGGYQIDVSLTPAMEVGFDLMVTAQAFVPVEALTAE